MMWGRCTGLFGVLLRDWDIEKHRYWLAPSTPVATTVTGASPNLNYQCVKEMIRERDCIVDDFFHEKYWQLSKVFDPMRWHAS
jgi:hypothetical protein